MRLTEEEQTQLEQWLNADQVGNMAVERPVVPSVLFPVNAPMGARAKLSKDTQRRIERMEGKRAKHREAVAARKRALPKGRYHHNRKKATKRKQAAERWKKQPYKSLVFGHGNWAITQEEWNLHLGDYWKLYDSKHLRVKRKWGKGTKIEPYTIWHLKVYYKDKLLWDGSKEMWIHLSQPNALDVDRAPEGVELFTNPDLFIRHQKVVWRGQKGIFIPA